MSAHARADQLGEPGGTGVGRPDLRQAPLPPPAWALSHVGALHEALASVEADYALIERWGAALHASLDAGGRLLAVGNGGSAAQAQHLTAELVGRFRHERRPFSALALHADTSTVTALGNDYGIEELFARQVRAHGRPGDIVIALSTSGRSPNILRAVRTATDMGLTAWALTGEAPNPVAMAADACVAVGSADTAAVQEVHQVLVHLLCHAVDRCVGVETDEVGAAP